MVNKSTILSALTLAGAAFASGSQENYDPEVQGDNWMYMLTPTASPIGNLNPTGTFALIAMTLNPDNIQTLDDNDCDGDKGLARFCTTTVDVTYETDCETSTTIYKKSTYNSKKNLLQ
ncbi:unnamed protein product [Ambrosiozyma monospora]|uniref:Unnamed protein product n=1 Tax=Ambrosiozyma monospora TaxID=43982 RepID=A0ACB5T0N3_AMBMO|nr:unnamed protein product [Ambrosiozyma monospora]